MSVMDKLKQLLKGHESKADTAVDKAGDTFDARTQGKYSGHVDKVQDQVKKQYGGGGQGGGTGGAPGGGAGPGDPPPQG
ncbi:antitoxin [Streptomyces sp. NPDC020875]|uniref:antitoxin n=1 Tax=Streptomyces sp. NPDC020875 TaxID=3154898 RepID=UPI0033E855E0